MMLVGQHHCNRCSYAHVLNLRWYPIIEYIESNCTSEAHEWTKSLWLNHATILYDMTVTVGSPGDTLEMGVFINVIQKTLYRLLEVHVPTKLVKTVVGGSGASEF